MNIDDHDTSDELDCCDICGERLTENDVAEMYDVAKESPQEHVICHVQCGLDARLEIA